MVGKSFEEEREVGFTWTSNSRGQDQNRWDFSWHLIPPNCNPSLTFPVWQILKLFVLWTYPSLSFYHLRNTTLCPYFCEIQQQGGRQEGAMQGRSSPLAHWPWASWGVLKYSLYVPLAGNALYGKWLGEFSDASQRMCYHILWICALRCLVVSLWCCLSNFHCLAKHHKIVKKGVGFEQVDREWDWDNYVILQAYMALGVSYLLPFLKELPTWNSTGLIYLIALHMGPAEALYYGLHRLFHSDQLFRNYHSLHHSATILQSPTGGTATFLEHLALSVIMGIPLVGASVLGGGSLMLVYLYVIGFDFLRSMGHSNVEVVPAFIFRYLPFLRYFVYTPTYHSLHHVEPESNFCLFMPLYDYLGGTLNPKSWKLYQQYRQEQIDQVPDFVFLAHVVDFSASLHVPFVFRSFSATPFKTRWFCFPCIPWSMVAMFAMWKWAKTFINTAAIMRGHLLHTWVIPRFGFQYFLPLAKNGINQLIENTILDADRLGVKVLSLAALNKNEALNGGGTLFIEKLCNLRVKVVHGNTLTAAVTLNEIHPDVKEVFITGATSKLGRAIALYLCTKGVRVLMLTSSAERFQAVQKEAPVDCQKLLVQVTKYQAGQNCKTWIVGKWISFKEQNWAPSGTHFHQFVVPPILHLRRDCTYGNLAAMKLPDDVEGLGACEYTMDRMLVHACHAGGIVHLLEEWEHHEVGAIDLDRIDLVWKAALKHGFKPVTPSDRSFLCSS